LAFVEAREKFCLVMCPPPYTKFSSNTQRNAPFFAHMEKMTNVFVCVCWGVNPQDEAIPNIRGIRQGNNN